MARFVPPTRLAEIEHDSERVVCEALATLHDDYIVMHSFPWLRPNRAYATEPLREGEADFVILHPAKGILVLEVKGGTPELRGRSWFRGQREMRDPFDQASRNRFALLDALRERTAGRLEKGKVICGHAVVFPHVQYDGPLPLNTDKRIFLDARHLKALPDAIDAAFASWTTTPMPLVPVLFAELQRALMPSLRLMRCASAQIESESARLVQITLDQRATLMGLLANARVLVEGTAGSGKTLLALEFALALAEQGERALLLCFNKDLAAWLQEQAASDPRASGGRVEISTFHSYAMRLAHRAGVEFDVSEAGFWDEEAPLLLEQALDVLRAEGSAPIFDAVIVDEAQDFAPDWWVTIEGLTKGGRAGRLYAFHDLHQSLRSEPQLPSVPLQAHFRLTTNCRNTRMIAQTAATLSPAKVSVLPSAPLGESPAMHRAASSSAGVGIALGILRKLFEQGVRPHQVVLLGPAAHDRGALSATTVVDGVRLVDDAKAWRRGDGVLITTARAFKGLEADVVILYDLSTFGTLFTRADLYVAWTRARHRLFAVCASGEVRAVVELALAAAPS